MTAAPSYLSAAAFTGFLTVLSACDAIMSGPAYTLYRGSPVEPSGRVHVATFDANESEEYNRENCQIAADLFSAQPEVIVRYWCEKGRYR